MPQYRYYFEDLSTGLLLDELPGLYGTYMTANLSSPGEMTASIRMDTPYRTVTNILESTMPGRTKIWVERDSVLIWGGILWARTYQSDGRSMQFNARTFDSYLGKDYNDVDVTIGPGYKVDITRDFFVRAFTQGAGAPSDCLEFFPVIGNEHTHWDDMVKEYVRGGVEYRILYYKNSVGKRCAKVQFGRWDRDNSSTYRMLGVPYTEGTPRQLFQYPGDISKYFWPESAADAANELAGIGKADGATTPRAVVSNPSSIQAGYPRLRKRFTFSETESEDVLTQTLNSMRDTLAPPRTDPTFALVLQSGTVDGQFGNWALGDYFDYVIADPYRFPSARRGSTRITGWALKPGDSDGAESVGLTTVDYNARILNQGE
jgi:hypothetical protein